MAKSQEWKTNSTTIEDGRVKISSADKYNKNGANALTTFTPQNLTGRVKLVTGSADPVVDRTYYSIDSDGYIDYYVQDFNDKNKFVKYSSIDDIANGISTNAANNGKISGYTTQTSNIIKNTLQGNLTLAAANAQIPGAANPAATQNNSGNTGNNQTPNQGGNTGTGPGPISLTISGAQNVPVGGFKYPLHLGSQSADNLDRIKFTQGEYVGTTIAGGNFNLSQRAFSDRQFKFNYGSVTLGIQPTISDKNTVQWNGSKIDELQAQAAKLSLQVMKSDGINAAGKTIFDALAGVAEELKAEGSDTAKALNIFFAAKAAGLDPGQLTSRVGGAVLNPNLELLFEGPTLRQFNYTFTMSAREQDETNEIKGIIKYFKQGMAIKKSTTGMFLKSPNVFKIQYLKGSGTDDHDGLNRIKTCALLDCSVDYTPAGNYTTYEDGSMTMYKMTLSFGELNPLYAEDYASAGPIGF